MNCNTFKRNSIYYLDNELEGVVNKDMSEHLEHCSDCSKYYENKLRLRETFKEIYMLPVNRGDIINSSILNKLKKSYYKRSPMNIIILHLKRYKFSYISTAAVLALSIQMLPFVRDGLINYKEKALASSEVKYSTNNTDVDSSEITSELMVSNADTKEKSKDIDYKTSSFATNNFIENTFEITTFDGLEFGGWLNSNEILIMLKKDQQPVSTSPYPIRTLAILNIEGNVINTFPNTNIGHFIGISPDKSYALYSEPKFIPEVESSEWKEELSSGKLLNYEIKLVDLRNGSITKFNSQHKNKDAAYSWISSGAILGTYPYENIWEVADLKGNILKRGTLKGENYLGLTGTDLHISGSEVSGTIYYKEALGAPTKINALDVNTGDIKTIISKEIASWCTYQEGVMLLDSSGTREVTLQSLDNDGNVLRDYKIGEMVNVEESVLSPDKAKIALAGNFGGWTRKVMLLDLKTGELKDIFTSGSIENLNWSSDGKYISLASRNSWEDEVRSFIISIGN